jgi:hypothetical protein
VALDRIASRSSEVAPQSHRDTRSSMQPPPMYHPLRSASSASSRLGMPHMIFITMPPQVSQVSPMCHLPVPTVLIRGCVRVSGLTTRTNRVRSGPLAPRLARQVMMTGWMDPLLELEPVI